MPFNLLLFPLVGGYYFLIRFKRFKYLHQRLERQKLLFNSIIAGTILLFIAFCLTWTCFHLFPHRAAVLKANFPINLPFFGTTLFSFILGILIAEVGNLFVDEKKAISDSIKAIGNELELLFESSLKKEQLIQVTLKNDKFYIGWVKALPIPQQSSYVHLLPAFSGYRDSTSKKLVFTTQYLDVYASYVQGAEVLDLKSLTSLVVKIDEIITANIFDIDMYERFNSLDAKGNGEQEHN